MVCGGGKYCSLLLDSGFWIMIERSEMLASCSALLW
jgi:hypothetical protein